MYNIIFVFNAYCNSTLNFRYETQLAQEKDILLKIKGENGIMKKKFIELQKDIEVQREEIKILFQQKKELYEIIAIFERDMA